MSGSRENTTNSSGSIRMETYQERHISFNDNNIDSLPSSSSNSTHGYVDRPSDRRYGGEGTLSSSNGRRGRFVDASWGRGVERQGTTTGAMDSHNRDRFLPAEPSSHPPYVLDRPEPVREGASVNSNWSVDSTSYDPRRGYVSEGHRRPGRRGGFQGSGRGRDAPHRRDVIARDIPSGREESNRQGGWDGSEGEFERREQDRSGESGLSRDGLQHVPNRRDAPGNFISGDFRVEVPDQNSVSAYHMPEVHEGNSRERQEDRRIWATNARGRTGGRFRGAADSGNWRHNIRASNRDLTGNPDGVTRVSRHQSDGVEPETRRYTAASSRIDRKTTDSRLWRQPGEKLNVPQLVQELEDKLTRGKVECMICYDMVGRGAPVWSCASCYSIFHLPCIRKWAKAPSSADLSVSASGHAFEGNWRCPGCQAVQLISANDLRYHCFCGQLEDPPLDYYLTPHSCGGSCQKALDRGKAGRCKHHCTMQCHPGPCPPCTARTLPQPCPCGKSICTQRCSEQEKVGGSCGQPCERRLNCGRHMCNQICHEGACGSCDVLVIAKCFCGRQQEGMHCGQLDFPGEVNFEGGVFSCEFECPKMLPCGKHKCTQKCHPGSCGECELSPSVVQSCPCGKTVLKELLGAGKPRQSCTDLVPTCHQACGKLLPCKKHVCRSLCHMGLCPSCLVPVEQKCQCGSSSRTVACHISLKVDKVIQGEREGLRDGVSEEAEDGLFMCDKKCEKKKNCGRHRCNNRCCPAAKDGASLQEEITGVPDLHLCTLPCGKRLRCRQHNCQELCHTGHCRPCMETTFTELSCACGQTSIPPPVPCGTPLPSCPYPCSITQVCGHEATHLCHFGDCPPCTVPVSKECVGNHVVLRGVPCGSRDIKCNKLCGKTRQCGFHACGRTCHLPPCDSVEVEAASPGVGTQRGGVRPSTRQASCGQACGAPRRDCSHTCAAVCHPASPCPETPCKANVTITCVCGRLTAEVPCDTGGSSTRGASEAAAMALSRLPSPLQPLEGKERERVPLGQRKLACDDDCAKLEKKRILADAFGAATPGEAVPSLEGGLVGSEVLAEIARRDPQWVASIEDRFKYLLLGPKNGSGAVGNLRLHVFCATSKERREVIYQLAERWGLSVTGVGREPRRFVIAHVTTKSKVPARGLFSKGGTLPATGQARAPPFNSLVDMEPGLVVTLLDLPRDADVSTLVLRFGGECELVWLNDKNALAIFSDAARAATALRRVDHASAYRGATGLPRAVGSSTTRSGAWGPPSTGLAGAKSSSIKKGMQDSNWVEDAWGDEERVGNQDPVGAWQHKVVPIATNNPWGALAQGGLIASTAQSQGSSSSSRHQASGHTSESTLSSSGGGRRVGMVPSTDRGVAHGGGPGTVSAAISSPTLVGTPEADNCEDDWEKVFEGGGL